ncbi:hypothetical protein JXM67_00050 [candidate division WOR-3 bacterium]|nr:hypothetical protein [candidate division WOR-3 bacterium]
MPLEIREVKTAKEKRLFIYLPEKLYEKQYPQWVHPIYPSQKKFFNPRRHKPWSFSDAILYLAWRDDNAVGRVMGIINHRVNEFHKIRESRFAFFDCIEDQDVASSLLTTVENWVSAKGYRYIVGPLGFTNTDPLGVLVEGFEERAAVGAPWHPAYTHKLIEHAGYRKEVDWVTYYVDFRNWPAVYEKIGDRVLGRSRYELWEFSSRNELKHWVKPAFYLMNETYRGLYGFSPLTDQEIDKISNEYLPVLDPRLVKMVTLDGKVIAFAVGLQDISEGIRSARGKLFPFGILKIIRARRRSKRLDMLLGAIKEEHRGKGLDVLMANALHSSGQKMGITHADSHHELESNVKMRGEMERLGGRIYKRHRLYRKDL